MVKLKEPSPSKGRISTARKNLGDQFRDSRKMGGIADFANSKNSKDSEGSSKKTGASSAKSSVYIKDPYDGKYIPSVQGAEDENSRASRYGKSETMSGPKSRKRNDDLKKKSDAPFLKHTVKGKQ